MEDLGRVFVAVPLPAEVRLALTDSIASLEIPGKQVPPENWHLTLRFLGDIDEITYDRFLSVLEGVDAISNFALGLDGLGAFPHARAATVVFAGVSPDGLGPLGALNVIAEDAAQSAGIEPEERPFRPHLTLSRVRPPEDVRHLADVALDLAWRVDRVVVLRSHLGSGPARYEKLEELALGG